MRNPLGSIPLTRDWSKEQYPWLLHAFSTRSGGASACYGGDVLNLGWTKEDDPHRVRDNRQLFLSALVEEDTRQHFALVGTRQTHSATVHEVRGPGAAAGELENSEGKPVLEGDGLITDQSGILIAVGTADCVPVLVADTRKRVVATFHAGWRGTVLRIVESGIARMRQNYGSRPEDLIAAIGPSIGPCCYSVGDDVQAAFASNFRYADTLFREVSTPEPWRTPASHTSSEHLPTRVHLDLWEANRCQLRQSGLADAQITTLEACTACSRDSLGNLQYFSHRAEDGVTGRMLSAIGIDNSSPKPPSSLG